MAGPAKIDKEAKEKYIDRLTTPEAKSIVRKVIDNHLFHISQKGLLQALEKATKELNSYLANSKVQTFSVAYATKRSQAWVASLALRYLEKLPKAEFNIATGPDTLGFESISLAKLMSQPNHALVIFDDCSYSGAQVIDQILDNLRFTIALGKIQGIMFPTHRFEIILVIPFMTSYAKNTISKYALEIDFKLITVETIPAISEINLTEEERNLFYEMYDLDEKKAEKKTLAFCDWKKPDAWSSLGMLFEGITPYKYDKFYGKSYDEIKEAGLTVCNTFIPDIKSVYKLY